MWSCLPCVGGCQAAGPGLRQGAIFLDTALLKHQRALRANLSKIKGSGLQCTVREDEISFPQLERLDTF